MAAIALNARFYTHVPTGMQRYGLEMAKRLYADLDIVRPGRPMAGAEGHLWEQLYLPTATRGRLLWSPNNTGPVAVSRQICTIHDIIPIERPDWFNARFSAWYRWLLPRLVRRVEHIIAVSEFTKSRVLERFGIEPSKVTVVWNGVDGRYQPRPCEEVRLMRRDLKIPSSHYLLCLGSLEPRKNLRRLLSAWQQISPQLPSEIILVIAGKVGASSVFASAGLTAIPDRVHFTGYVEEDQLPALHSGALALVYPSLYEGFGLPPLEAMACGTPVVTSFGTSLTEVVGDAAVLVDPLDEMSIADGIRQVVEDAALRDRLRTLGLARAKNITWERSAQETRKVLSAFL